MESLLSISDAAKQAGISRTTLYKKYIDTGVISVQRVNDQPRIDAAELIRVFGNLNIDVKQSLTQDNNDFNNRITELEAEVQRLKSENELLKALNEAQERNLSDLRRGFELIEHSAGKKKGIWGRIFG